MGWISALESHRPQQIPSDHRISTVLLHLLASTAVGTLEFRNALEPVRDRNCPAQFIQGWADDVDFLKKTISIEEAVVDPHQGLAPASPIPAGSTGEKLQNEKTRKSKKGQLFDLKYDKLVISVGCYSQTFNIPGIKDNANLLKDVGDARKIRKRILECFEMAALPTTPDSVRQHLLHFAVVGGGPTGVEFSSELHDMIEEDMKRLYPDLAKFCKTTVFDVAPEVLSSFDESLSKYATNTFKRQGIEIRTSRSVQGLDWGLPGVDKDLQGKRPGLTLKVKEDGEIGVGMVVWSTGLMMNPFIEKTVTATRDFPPEEAIFDSDTEVAKKSQWTIKRDTKSGSLITDDRLRVTIEAQNAGKQPMEAFMKDVFAIGDCAIVQETQYPATAQVANQKADWLAKRLNNHDLRSSRFKWRDMGTLTYLGNWRGIMQGGSGAGNLSGHAAWLIWRSAYLVKTRSWRNRILVPIHWCVRCMRWIERLLTVCQVLELGLW